MKSDPLVDFLEKTFADSYRKEVDQEENIWRSLPFFAATLALELTALSQIRGWLATGTGGVLFASAVALLAVTALTTIAALVSLALSVWPADFQYVASEPSFRDYAEAVRAEAAGNAAGGDDPEDAAAIALYTVKAVLAEQYALAVDNNRRINQGRASWRGRAGLATLVSVFAVLVLVALAVVTNLNHQGHGQVEANAPGKPGSTVQEGSRPGAG